MSDIQLNEEKISSLTRCIERKFLSDRPESLITVFGMYSDEAVNKALERFALHTYSRKEFYISPRLFKGSYDPCTLLVLFLLKWLKENSITNRGTYEDRRTLSENIENVWHYNTPYDEYDEAEMLFRASESKYEKCKEIFRNIKKLYHFEGANSFKFILFVEVDDYSEFTLEFLRDIHELECENLLFIVSYLGSKEEAKSICGEDLIPGIFGKYIRYGDFFEFEEDDIVK